MCGGAPDCREKPEVPQAIPRRGAALARLDEPLGSATEEGSREPARVFNNRPVHEAGTDYGVSNHYRLGHCNAFSENWIYVYGGPRFVLTDNSTPFAAKFFDAVCALLGVPHPQTNEQTERF